ncbi:MAG: MFS transporter [Bacteroidetes bacterium GWE2_41_25]|nr:MAG: MFS transporter [Bacteroidetes bacterium GWA2_40_15]OFX92478.1 MAG: MFS transporter [Bacteroidetes bacterium GWE2_41_25]OFY00539.1 MAG: MFS transporter [Bacteroidetes bacterium GWC2_40_22]OFY59430.1 MAG: MFS transporter [Bacteroidetes bacterium GWF2_41_9]HAM09157.1 MFS transporter [Bacteroidales bacterium]
MKRTSRNSYIIIVGLLLVATSLSFLDRQVLSVSIIKIRDELIISDIEYGFINSGFLVSYAIMFTLGGVLIDRFGSRLGLAFSVGFWSFATLLHSLANSVFHFGFFRFLLGAGEGGCFPGAVKAVIEKVPKSKHAVANGIAIGGAALGAVIAPPLCAWLLVSVGWRTLFLITGSFGFLWLAAWLFFYRKTDNSETGSEETRVYIPPMEKIKFISLLKNRKALVFIVIRFILDPIFYFYMFWIPKYLNEIQSMSLEVIGSILWIPFLALGVGNFLGGWFSDLILKKTSDTGSARKIVMGVAAALTVPVVTIGFLHSSVIIIILMTLAFFAHGLWITNYITSIGDIFGNRVTSTVVGLSGSAGAISALVLNPFIGFVVTNFSYSPLWWYAGLMYPVAFIILIYFIPKIKLMTLDYST